MAECFLGGAVGSKIKTGTVTTSGNQTTLSVSGVGFAPDGVIVTCDTQAAYTFDGTTRVAYQYNDGTNKISIDTVSGGIQVYALGGTLTSTSDGFSLTNFASAPFVNATFFWHAWKK